MKIFDFVNDSENDFADDNKLNDFMQRVIFHVVIRYLYFKVLCRFSFLLDTMSEVLLSISDLNIIRNVLLLKVNYH